MPDFVHVLEECFERLVERAVGVGYESYAFHAILLFSVFFGKLPAKFVFHSDSCLPNYAARPAGRACRRGAAKAAVLSARRAQPVTAISATPATARSRKRVAMV